jgi:phage shock protein E
MSRPQFAPGPALYRLAILIIPAVLALAAPAWADEPYWIDVRTESEYADGHVEGAVLIPYTEIAARIDEVTTDKDARIYLYCRSGRRSGIALQALEEAGYANAVNAGGLNDARQIAVRLETCKENPSADC